MNPFDNIFPCPPFRQRRIPCKLPAPSMIPLLIDTGLPLLSIQFSRAASLINGWKSSRPAFCGPFFQPSLARFLKRTCHLLLHAKMLRSTPCLVLCPPRYVPLSTSTARCKVWQFSYRYCQFFSAKVSPMKRRQELTALQFLGTQTSNCIKCILG